MQGAAPGLTRLVAKPASWHLPGSEGMSFGGPFSPSQAPQCLPFSRQKWRWSQPGREKGERRRALWSRKRGRHWRRERPQRRARSRRARTQARSWVLRPAACAQAPTGTAQSPRRMARSSTSARCGAGGAGPPRPLARAAPHAPSRCALQDCGKEFTHTGNFKRHIRIHTGEKPFSCRECSKAFSDPAACKAHEKTHRLAPTAMPPVASPLSCPSRGDPATTPLPVPFSPPAR